MPEVETLDVGFDGLDYRKVYFNPEARECYNSFSDVCTNKGYFWWSICISGALGQGPPTSSQGYCIECTKRIFRNNIVMLNGFKTLISNHPEIALED